MSNVLQCPYCDLRFSTRSELEQHEAIDHPDAQWAAERPARSQPEPEAEQPEPEPAPPAQPEELQPAPKRGFLSRLFKRR